MRGLIRSSRHEPRRVIVIDCYNMATTQMIARNFKSVRRFEAINYCKKQINSELADKLARRNKKSFRFKCNHMLRYLTKETANMRKRSFKMREPITILIDGNANMRNSKEILKAAFKLALESNRTSQISKSDENHARSFVSLTYALRKQTKESADKDIKEVTEAFPMIKKIGEKHYLSSGSRIYVFSWLV